MEEIPERCVQELNAFLCRIPTMGRHAANCQLFCVGAEELIQEATDGDIAQALVELSADGHYVLIQLLMVLHTDEMLHEPELNELLHE